MSRLSSDLSVLSQRRSGKLGGSDLRNINRKEETWEAKRATPRLSLKNRAQGSALLTPEHADDVAVQYGWCGRRCTGKCTQGGVPGWV